MSTASLGRRRRHTRPSLTTRRRMSLLGWLNSLFSSDKLKIKKRFELSDAIRATTAQIYKARDRRTGKVYALKVVDKPDGTRSPSQPKEGEVAHAIKHPRVVRTLEQGVTSDDYEYIVMEYLQGKTLAQLNDYRLRWDGRRLNLVRQMAEALGAVHDAGYLHCDIRMENFIVDTEKATVKLIDFGDAIPNWPELTAKPARRGRPEYTPPELLRRKPIDKRLDVFAFGVTAYTFFAGSPPWDAHENRSTIARALRQGKDIKQFRPQINNRLARAIHTCLLSDPAERFATMDDFLRDVDGIENEDDGAPQQAPRASGEE